MTSCSERDGNPTVFAPETPGLNFVQVSKCPFFDSLKGLGGGSAVNSTKVDYQSEKLFPVATGELLGFDTEQGVPRIVKRFNAGPALM